MSTSNARSVIDSPLSAECIASRDARRHDRAFTRLAAEIDMAVLNARREQQS